MSPSVKVYYFSATGRANQIRLALAAGGVAFEDIFGNFPLSAEQKVHWNKLTNNNTTFSAPIMTVDEGTDNERVYLQSSAVLRKAGRMGDLKMTLADDADGDKAEYLTDRAIADADDLRSASYKAFVIFGASKDKANSFAKEILPKHVKNMENQFVSAGGDYWGGSSTISLADVAVYDAIVFFGHRLIDGAEGIESPIGPALKAWIERVESNDRIKAYLAGGQFQALYMKAGKEALGY